VIPHSDYARSESRPSDHKRMPRPSDFGGANGAHQISTSASLEDTLLLPWMLARRSPFLRRAWASTVDYARSAFHYDRPSCIWCRAPHHPGIARLPGQPPLRRVVRFAHASILERCHTVAGFPSTLRAPSQRIARRRLVDANSVPILTTHSQIATQKAARTTAGSAMRASLAMCSQTRHRWSRP
jgi:hypothetical protein